MIEFKHNSLLQIDRIKKIGLLESLKNNDFEKIYHPIYPSLYDINIDDRLSLFYDMTNKSQSLFKEMVEEYLKITHLEDEIKEYLFQHSYNLGHIRGYKEIFEEYKQILNSYLTMNEEDFMDIIYI